VSNSIFSIALVFFLVANPIGNSPTILSLVKHFDFERQKKIIFREAMISLLIALFFQFCGELFLGILKISDYALSFTGGIVLFMVALQMIFHKPEDRQNAQVKQEPFIVPIATPLISGPGLMTIIMVTSKAQANDLKIFIAVLVAWVGVTLVLLGAPYLQKLVGKRGMSAMEQVMGMILGLISMEMIIKGAGLFVKTLS
jgi:multiple antibiotic resistance protein